ncbi:AmpD protein [Neisseria sp. HSC-16F19]|nr:1,6-anhydro-N-acetylmuramyl-L-alanine amidase AmpD [Neisseria sp. HSC-16F19]MCP2040358.1 AmpD protein [Neisseria sp. HSC-16F19]
MSAIWHRGWWQAAQALPSPNFSARPPQEKVSLAVIHNISLPPFEYGSDAVAALFTNTIRDDEPDPFLRGLQDLRVSSHFFIRRNGATLQCVSVDDMAFHAGVSSFRGRSACNAFSVGIELEGCDFEPFAPVQYSALITLLQALCAHYPITAVTGHQHIAPGRKSDPGHFFDWARLRNAGLPVETAFQAA